MKVYVEVQSDINQKRLQEIEEGQKLIQQNQQQQPATSQSGITTTAASDVTGGGLTASPQLLA